MLFRNFCLALCLTLPVPAFAASLSTEETFDAFNVVTKS